MRFLFVPLLLIANCLYSQSFSTLEVPDFAKLTFEHFEWADYDQDGDLDFAGVKRHSGQIILFRNNGNGEFNEVIANIPNIQNSQFEWADMDNDNDVDIVVAGCDGFDCGEGRNVFILRNDGNDVFTKIALDLPVTENVSIADFSSDGNPDLILQFRYGGHQFFRNDGSYHFSAVYEIPGNTDPVYWADFDNDGRLDFGLGRALYKNTGANGFEKIDAGFYSEKADYLWMDIDSDGDQDFFRLAITIGSYNPNSGSAPGGRYLEVFENLNGTTFQNRGLVDSISNINNAIVADFDGDGDSDIAMSLGGSKNTKVLWNQGTWSFTSEPIYSSPEFMYLRGGDFDHDGDFDLLGSGIFLQKTIILRNQYNLTSNSQKPANLAIQTSDQSVTLSWDASPSHRFNLFVRKDDQFLITPQANLISGAQEIPVVGNNGVSNHRTLTLADLEDGYYTWSVQSVNNAHATSPFSEEREFTVYKNMDANAPAQLLIKNISSTSVGLEWLDNSSNETAYLVERSETSGNTAFDIVATLPANTTSFTDLSVTANRAYYYRVRAQLPQLALSNVVKAKTTPYLADRPFDLKATASNAQVLLNWSYDGTNHEGFIIYRSVKNINNFVAIDKVSSGTLSYADLGLDGLQNYFYQIAAFHTNGNSDYSNVGSATTPMHLFEADSIPSFKPILGETSMSWADYNNDGLDDLFLSNQTQLLKNNGDGSFTKIENSGIAFKTSSYSRSSSAWGDYDNDGILDIVLSNSERENLLFHGNGDGTFQEVFCSITRNEYEAAYITWSDADNDGDLDLFLSGYGAPLSYYRYDGNNVFTPSGLPLVNGYYSSNSCVAITDFNNDGSSDFFAGNDAADGLYTNDGTGEFSLTNSRVISDTDFPCCPIATPLAIWSDYNNDLIPDLTVIHRDHYDLIYKGTPTGLDSAYAFSADYGSSQNHAFWEDFDNDGDVDLLNLDYSKPQRLLENLESGVLTERRTGVLYNQLNNYITLSWADLNNDGFRDLVTITSDSTKTIFKNIPNGNKWLKISLAGRRSNSKGVGAKIYLKSKGEWQRKDVLANHGFLVQEGFETIFGLNQANVIDSIRVEWPSGARQILTSIQPNQKIVIRESEAQVQPLYKPSNLRGVIGLFSTIKLFWQDNSDDEDGFIIQKSEDGVAYSEIARVPANENELMVTDLEKGKTYFFRVKGYKGAVSSGWTNVYRDKITIFKSVEAGFMTRGDLEIYSVSWSDFTGEGMEDLFIASSDWPGDGLYTTATTGLFRNHQSFENWPNYTRSGAWGDYDNDGNADLFVAIGGNVLSSGNELNDKLYKNKGNGQFVKISAEPVTTDGVGSHVGAWGDLNNDGYIDLTVSTDSRLLNYLNSEGTNFQPQENGATEFPSTLVTLSDFDGDNDLDLFTIVQHGHLQIWENTQGKFATRNDRTSFHSAKAFCVDDFDENGMFDLITVGEGATFYSFDLPSKSFKKKNVLFADVAVDYTSCTSGDFDNNGHLDILLTRNGGKNVFFLNQGRALFDSHITEDINGIEGITSVSTSDHDRDGDLDLFACRPAYPSKNYFFAANTGYENWCQVKLVGHVSNRDGIGAKIKLITGSQMQLREIRTNTGSYSSNEQVAHFGLGNATTFNYLKIEWPSGQEQWLANPATNKLLVIEEGPGDEPPAAPAAPSDLHAALDAGSAINLNWLDHSDRETGFVIERSINNSGYSEIAKLPSGITNYVDKDFRTRQLEEVNVSYRVAAVIDDIYSNYSNEASVVVPVTGIEGSAKSLEIYPNPATEFFRIRSVVDLDEVRILDNKGSERYNIVPVIGTRELDIDTNKFQSGIYLIQIRRGSFISYHKIIVADY